MSDTAEVPLAAANYDNNNEANASKMKHQQHHHHQQQQHRCSTTELHRTKHKRNSLCGGRAHLNHLWSVWYGFFGTFLQAYTAVKCTKRFLRYSVLPWTSTTAIWELHACLLVTGFAVLLLPVFLASAVFKVGNHANDGFKLGRTSSICDKDPPSSLLGPKCSLWRHGGPTAAFLHLVIAFSLLVPKLVMEARLVEAGFLPSDTIWRTDLDFMVVHHDRLVVLSFMTAAAPSNNTTPTIVPSMSSSFEASTVTSLLNTTKVTPAALSFNFIKYLKDFFSLEETDNNIDSGFGSSVSVEYLNYALALFVYSVRYPAVFWNTNKCFGIIFSIQLLANGVQSLLAFAGMSVLYKVQIIGAWKALPLLRHYPDGMSPLGGRSPFLLNPHVTLALFALSSLLVLSSSLILYLYGHGRFNSFLNQQRDRKHIFVTSSTHHHHSWGYFTHCAALCVLVAVAVAYAPLLYDYTVVYRGSLDGAVLACIVASISHLFLWVLVWLFLTIKHRWTFKLRVTVGRATVRSARSVKLVTDIDLVAGGRTEDSGQQPLLIVGNGRTYTVSEHSPKKAIMSVIQKAAMEKKSKASTASSSVGDSEIADEDAEEQIYWLRPALVSPQRSPDSGSEDKLCWFSSRNRKQSGAGQGNKHKVTFNEASSTSNIRHPKGGIPKLRSSGNGGVDEDDGDYATLRELPLIPSLADPEDDTTSEEGKLLACVRDDNVTYASTSRDLIPPGDYEDPSPLLTPEPLSDREDTATASRLTAANAKTNPVSVTVHPQVALTQTPRCLRRADSGMPHEELTPRSDSISTESSSSPPEALGSNHSETSSGVHSNASSDHQNHPQPNEQHPQNNNVHHLVKPGQNHAIKQQESQPAPPNQYSGVPHHLPGPVNHQLSQVIASRRATSVADLAQQKEDHQWKSCSLQRNVQPPGTAAFHNMMNSVLQNGKKPDQMYGYSGPHAHKIDNSGYGCTNSIQQTQVVQPPYGYTKTSAEAQYGFTKAIPLPQTNGYQNGDPRYGYTKSTASTEPQNHGYVNAGSTSIKDSNYGYAKSAHSTPSHKADPPESHHVRHNSLYGYSQITNPENVILPRNSLYGYTSTASSVTGDAETSNYSPSTSQHGLYSYTNPTPDVISPASSSIYGFTSQKSEVTEHGGIPAVILESSESTVVIRRKIPKPLVVDAQTIPVITEEPFGRSTNMKMTSFTEQSDLKNIQASSATLPLYPTQPPQLQYPHCSTMPLPHPSPSSNPQTPLATGTSCNVYPRQHTTIPTHHNGVRLFPPFTKRAKTIQNGQPRMNGSSEILYGSSTGTK